MSLFSNVATVEVLIEDVSHFDFKDKEGKRVKFNRVTLQDTDGGRYVIRDFNGVSDDWRAGQEKTLKLKQTNKTAKIEIPVLDLVEEA